MSLMQRLVWGWLGLCAIAMLTVMVYVSGWLAVVGILAFSALTTLALIFAAQTL